MKFCSNCGKEISIEAAFCPHCGKALGLTVEQETPSRDTTKGSPFAMPFDKKLISKILLIASCAILSILFFTEWFSNGHTGSFSPFDRTMRIAQFSFNGQNVRVQEGERTHEDQWGGSWIEPIVGDKFIVDPVFVIYDLALAVLFIISIVMLLKVIYNISRKKERGIVGLYNKALQTTVITCVIAFIGSIILNNVTRKMGYGAGDYDFISFKSAISFSFSFYLTVVLAIGSRVFISHYYKEAQK